MERDGSFSSFNWQSNSHNSSLPVAEMNGSNSDGTANMGDQSSGFLNLNWDQSSTEQTANFESALSSLVSSPTSSNPNPNPNPSPTPDSVVIRELIGRLGSICSNNKNNYNNHGEEQSTNTSCYSTPLNSPPKLNLLSMMDHPQLQLPRPSKNSHNPIPFNADPGFAERAARFSCFGAARSNYAQFGSQEPGKLSRASSSQSLKGMATSYKGKDDGVGGGPFENDMMLMTMMGSGSGNNNSQQESSPPTGSEGNVKKRKSSTASSNKGSNSGGSRAKETSHPSSSKVLI